MDAQKRIVQSGCHLSFEREGTSLAPIVKRIALKEDDRHYAESVRVVQGKRPGTKSPSHIQRPFARVIVGDEQATEKEFGGKLPKKGFLRRAIAEMGD